METEGKKNLSFAGAQMMGMNNTQVGGMGGGNQSQNMGRQGNMQSSNASLNDSSYMPMMSRTQEVLQRAKRSQAIRQKVKD